MEIEDIQKRVLEFSKKRSALKGYELTQEICLIHLMEELGELSAQIYNKKARPEQFNPENIKEEICDVILESMMLAELTGMNLSEELNKKIDELNNRKL